MFCLYSSLNFHLLFSSLSFLTPFCLLFSKPFMISFLTALCDRIFLSFILTSNFISTVPLQVYFFEHTAYILEHLLFSYGTVPAHQNTNKYQNSFKEIGINSFPKPFITSWAAQDYFFSGQGHLLLYRGLQGHQSKSYSDYPFS